MSITLRECPLAISIVQEGGAWRPKGSTACTVRAVDFADRLRKAAGILTGAVGMITAAERADHIIRTGQADVVVLARELLWHPYWPLEAARKLGAEGPWPNQYLRAKQ